MATITISILFYKNGPIPASFCLFSLFSHYNFNKTNWKKRRWCVWDLNPGPQDGRRRQNHRAMAATQTIVILLSSAFKTCWLNVFKTRPLAVQEDDTSQIMLAWFSNNAVKRLIKCPSFLSSSIPTWVQSFKESFRLPSSNVFWLVAQIFPANQSNQT